MENLDIRMMVSSLNLKYIDIAKQMGVSRVWLSTLMRHELTKENKDRVMKAIIELKDGDQRS
jgi:predicted XRE-type DNA-binding protein